MTPDREDRQRISRHLERLLDALRTGRSLTNHEVRQIAGSRGMGRVNELQQLGYDIEVKKVSGSTWTVTLRGRQPRADATPTNNGDLFANL